MGTGSAPGRKKDWELTQVALDMLLARLDPDRDQAGKNYEALRRKLTKFFAFRGCHDPEDQADKVLNITARKITEGEDVNDPRGYVLGIAHHVYKEAVKQWTMTRNALHKGKHELARDALNQTGAEMNQRCYEQCLQALPAEQRELIVSYYQGRNAPDRESLAAQRGVQLNALRVTAFRIRKKLKDCREKCVEKRSEM